MPFRHVVVDGSNLATEGRSTPSLQQLDEAVRAFQREFPGLESVTVVVDASFPNRIDKEELVRFEEARAHGEVVSPPAGAIGRGDAFLLRIAEKSKATVEAVAEPAPTEARRRRRRRVGPPPQAVNDPLAFIRFVADHKLGREVEAQVEAFTSHGAFVLAGGARCYVPLASLGDPPPRSARQVLQKGEGRIFVVQALDPQRRGIELALPQFARVSGAPTAETVEAEIARAAEESAPHRGTAPAKRAGKG